MDNKELDYSRLKALMSKVNEFVGTLPENMDIENGFTILLIAHDIKNHVSASYTFADKDDERESLIQCIDNAISGAALKGKDKNPQEFEILNSIAEYLMRLCAIFPSLYERFQEGVENFKKRKIIKNTIIDNLDV